MGPVSTDPPATHLIKGRRIESKDLQRPTGGTGQGWDGAGWRQARAAARCAQQMFWRDAQPPKRPAGAACPPTCSWAQSGSKHSVKTFGTEAAPPHPTLTFHPLNSCLSLGGKSQRWWGGYGSALASMNCTLSRCACATAVCARVGAVVRVLWDGAGRRAGEGGCWLVCGPGQASASL